MPRPDERRFVTFRRGYIRDTIVLGNFRIFLREQINPDTGVLFTEDEIARITQEGSRYYIEADAVDLMGQAAQQRGLWLADQTDPRRAHSTFLRKVWGPLWVGDPLPASGGSGTVTAPAPSGTIFLGSTTLGTPGVQVARDAAGNKYQVYFTAVTPGAGSVELTLRAIDTGSDTNPTAGTVLEWVNPPPGAAPECTVATDFSGGFEAETDQEYARRIWDAMLYRAGAGNGAQFRAWARAASVAIETAFVYSCAFNAGSVLVCALQRRGTATGPLARVPSVSTLTDLTNYIVPPNSPVVPEHVHVAAVPPVTQYSDPTLLLEMTKGIAAGWADAEPWPTANGVIGNLSSQTVFDVTDVAGSLPGGAASLSGADAPQLMVWHRAISRWEKLSVTSVTDAGGGTFNVVLASAPALGTIANDDFISPYTAVHEQIALALEAYFDELGPGEVIDLEADVRGGRAFRFPRPGRLYPSRAGQAAKSRIDDVLGTVVAESSVSFSKSEPDLPTDVVDGPNMLVLGRARTFPL